MTQSEWSESAVGSQCLSRYRLHVVLACVLAALWAMFAPFARARQSEKSERRIRILLLVDATTPLSVDYRTTGRRLRRALLAGAGGIAPILIESKVSSMQRSKESNRLQEAVGNLDRKPVIGAAMAAAVGITGYFEAVIPNDPSSFATKTEIDFARVQADGYRYVLVLREDFAGMITAWKMGTLSAGSYLRYELYDAATKKQLTKGLASAFALPQHELDPATTDRSLFLGEYPAAVGAACGRIYGELNKQGHLHTMAEAHGLGKEVPAVGEILDKYARLFDYNFKLPKDWHQVPGASKYSLIMEPNNADRAKFGVALAVDLLIEEFGQEVQDLDGYITIVFGRMRNLGYPVEDAEPFENLRLDTPHTGFLVDRPGGAGKELVLFRRLDDRFVVMYSVIFLQDFDGYLKKYSQDLETLMNKAEFKTRPST